MAEIGVVTSVTTATTRDGGQVRRKDTHTYGQAPVVAPDLSVGGLRAYIDGQGVYLDTDRPAGGYPILRDADGLYIDTTITGGGQPIQSDGTGFYIED